MGKKCNHCGLLNHFAKVCRKKLNNSKNSRQDAPINHVEISETTEQPEIQNVYFTNYNEQYNFEYESSDDNYLAIVETLTTSSIALQNITITIGKMDCHSLLDSGSGCTIINKSISNKIMLTVCKQDGQRKNH